MRAILRLFLISILGFFPPVCFATEAGPDLTGQAVAKITKRVMETQARVAPMTQYFRFQAEHLEKHEKFEPDADNSYHQDLVADTRYFIEKSNGAKGSSDALTLARRSKVAVSYIKTIVAAQIKVCRAYLDVYDHLTKGLHGIITSLGTFKSSILPGNRKTIDTAISDVLKDLNGVIADNILSQKTLLEQHEDKTGWGIVINQDGQPVAMDSFISTIFYNDCQAILSSLNSIRTIEHEKEAIRRNAKKKRQAAKAALAEETNTTASGALPSSPIGAVAKEAPASVTKSEDSPILEKKTNTGLSQRQALAKELEETEFKRLQKKRSELKDLIHQVFGPYYKTVSWKEWDSALKANGYTITEAGNNKREYRHLESGRQFRLENPHGDDANKLHQRDIFEVRKFATIEGLVPPGILPSHLIQPWLREFYS